MDHVTYPRESQVWMGDMIHQPDPRVSTNRGQKPASVNPCLGLCFSERASLLI